MTQFGKGGRSIHVRHHDVEQDDLARETGLALDGLGSLGTDLDREPPTFSKAKQAMVWIPVSSSTKRIR
jgi:hypothetical protein